MPVLRKKKKNLTSMNIRIVILTEFDLLVPGRFFDIIILFIDIPSIFIIYHHELLHTLYKTTRSQKLNLQYQ